MVCAGKSWQGKAGQLHIGKQERGICRQGKSKVCVCSRGRGPLGRIMSVITMGKAKARGKGKGREAQGRQVGEVLSPKYHHHGAGRQVRAIQKAR